MVTAMIETFDDANGRYFPAAKSEILRVPVGWYVLVVPIWAGEEEDPELDHVTDVETYVVRIAPDTLTEMIHDGAPAFRAKLAPGHSIAIPAENVIAAEALEDLPHDDTHDLRDRFFLYEETAREHAAEVERRFCNPAPWESFVALS